MYEGLKDATFYKKIKKKLSWKLVTFSFFYKKNFLKWFTNMP